MMWYDALRLGSHSVNSSEDVAIWVLCDKYKSTMVKISYNVPYIILFDIVHAIISIHAAKILTTHLQHDKDD